MNFHNLYFSQRQKECFSTRLVKWGLGPRENAIELQLNLYWKRQIFIGKWEEFNQNGVRGQTDMGERRKEMEEPGKVELGESFKQLSSELSIKRKRKMRREDFSEIFLWFYLKSKDLLLLDFPGGTVDKNPPANAGFEPCSGESPHVLGWLSLCATSTDLHFGACALRLLSPCAAVLKPACPAWLGYKRSHHNEKFAHCDKSSPCLPHLEGAKAKQGRPSTAKNK